MATTIIKMGKRGTLVLPVKLRKQFGLTDGSLPITEERDGGISLRPAFMYEPEVWSDKERAYVILSGCLTKEEWDRLLPDVVALGIDPAQVEGLSSNHRDSLPSEGEWDARFRRLPEKRIA